MTSVETIYKKYKVLKEDRSESHPYVKYCMEKERKHNVEVASLSAKYLSKKIGLKRMKEHNDLSAGLMCKIIRTGYFQRRKKTTDNSRRNRKCGNPQKEVIKKSVNFSPHVGPADVVTPIIEKMDKSIDFVKGPVLDDLSARTFVYFNYLKK